jgi:hypothetical protein
MPVPEFEWTSYRVVATESDSSAGGGRTVGALAPALQLPIPHSLAPPVFQGEDPARVRR